MKKDDICKLDNGFEILQFIHKEYEENGINIFDIENMSEKYYIIVTDEYNNPYNNYDLEPLMKLLYTFSSLDSSYEFEENLDNWNVRCYIWGSEGWLLIKRIK